MCALLGATGEAWTPYPATSMASLLRRSPELAANDNRARSAHAVAGALAIARRLLLGAGGIEIIAATARLLSLGQQVP